MELGKNIQGQRQRLGLSQEQLAERLGVSRQSVSKWETGAATPELEKVAAMARLFGVSMDELVLGDEQPAGGEPGGQAGVYAAAHNAGEGRNGIPSRRFIAGVALLCMGAVIFVLLFLLGGGFAGLIFVSPLLLCGLACIKARRHAGFWCFAAVYLPVHWYLKWATGVSFADLYFWLSDANPMRGIIYVLLVGCGVGLIVCGVHSFRDVSLSGKSRPWLRVALCAALYAALFALRSPVYELADGAETGVMATRALVRLFDTARYAVLACAVICASVAMRHGREKSAAQGDR